MASAPDPGPRGYLPPKAAKRARKIVLRSEMGLGWPLAAVGASALVAVAGGAYLVDRSGPPDPPAVVVAALADVPADEALAATAAGADIVVARTGTRVRAYRAPGVAVRWDASCRALIAEDGGQWSADGEPLSDAAPLTPLPTTVYGGDVYVDPTRPAAVPETGRPACDRP